MNKFILLLAAIILSAYTTAQFDVGVSSTSAITEPVSGCEVGVAQDSVRVLVQNYSSAFVPNNTITVNYTINQGVVVSQIITNNLTGFATINFLFDENPDLSACDTFAIKVWTDLAGDVNNGNDTLEWSFVNNCTIIPGIIDGSTAVCVDGNNETLELLGMQHGIVSSWSASTDNGATYAAIPGTGDFSTYNFNNLTQETEFRVDLNGGFCPNAISSTQTVSIDQSLNTGTVSPNLSICGGDLVEISISGFSSQLTSWLSSTDLGSTYATLGTNTSMLTFTDITETTYFLAAIESGTCGAGVSDTIKVEVIPASDAGSLNQNLTVCADENADSLSLEFFMGDIVDWEYNNNGTWLSLNYNDTSYSFDNLGQTTSFRALVQNEGCAIDTSNTVTVTLQNPPTVDAGFDENILLGSSTQLDGFGGLIAVWTPGGSLNDSTLYNPIASPDSTTTYTLTVMDGLGCVNSIEKTVTVVDTNVQLLIPNLITPNGDGANDTWIFSGSEKFNAIELTILNAYGKIIYRNENYLNDWDGTHKNRSLPDGGYAYSIQADEQNYSGIITIMKGE